ncbi:MAG: hypothetical protein ABI477_24610 [Chryseolinea sp.]
MNSRFEFGIYPGGAAGTDTGITSGPIDDPLMMKEALNQLQGASEIMIVRAYIGFKGAGHGITETPLRPEECLSFNRKLDLVLCFQSPLLISTEWKAFITNAIERFSTHLRYLQITEEANVNLPSLDGFYPDSKKALVDGVVWAKKEVLRLSLAVSVGFNATPDFNPDKTFWKDIKGLASDEFYKSLDYVGLDCFPDVFRALPLVDGIPDISGAIRMLLTMFSIDIVSAGIDRSIPLHITENGWPTGKSRSDERQAYMLEAIVKTLFALRIEFNIETYELFCLRDADSSVDDLFFQFGILRDDYSKKPAFGVFEKLIKELTLTERIFNA